MVYNLNIEFEVTISERVVGTVAGYETKVLLYLINYKQQIRKFQKRNG